MKYLSVVILAGTLSPLPNLAFSEEKSGSQLRWDGAVEYNFESYRAKRTGVLHSKLDEGIEGVHSESDNGKKAETFKEAILHHWFDKLIDGRGVLGFTDGEISVRPIPISIDDIDPHRSLLVHDLATLSSTSTHRRVTPFDSGVGFSLQRVLTTLANQVPGGPTAEDIFKQMWDTQNSSNNGLIPDNVHCDTNINGFPVNPCPRAEGKTETDGDIIDRINEYRPTALVNRIDLAHQDWRNCGEYRIIYGKDGGGGKKNLIIFESVLPNPKPGCRSGCRDVIDFWVSLSGESSPRKRALELEKFYFKGLKGYSPVVHVNHYSSSSTSGFYGGSNSGQIRTNQFMGRDEDDPWQLKEFKTFVSCSASEGRCDLDIIPISVKGNPYGELWNYDIANNGSASLSHKAGEFQKNVLRQVNRNLLGNPSMGRFSYAVQPNHNAALSTSQGFPGAVDNYRQQMEKAVEQDGSFENSLKKAGRPLRLTAAQLANRATALSCAGCHKPSTFDLDEPNAIGPGQQWPSADFVHVDVEVADFVPVDAEIENMRGFGVRRRFFDTPNAFALSPALKQMFLPARTRNLVNLHNENVHNCKPSLIPSLDTKRPITASEVRAFNSAVKDLVNPAILKRAKEQLREADASKGAFGSRLKPSGGRSFVNLAKQKEIIHEAEKEMLSEPDLRDLFERNVLPSHKQLEKVTLSPDQKRQMASGEGSLKSKIANELERRFPPRKTVTGSFRVH
ncbi:MAG: hypothetical protein CSB47_00890 [Proteobacteria bacterium]|nr:MAG: hypothetical protein CSB47_00890 [Pseudomonadota bacterium]